MKAQWVQDLTDGRRIDDSFALTARQLRTSRTGDAYLSLELGDRTGRIGSVLFKPSSTAVAIPTGAIVRATGVVTTYRGQRRVSLQDMKVCRSYSAEDFVPGGAADVEELKRRFRTLAASVTDRRLRRVLSVVFGDKGFLRRFEQCPGAQSHHHAYLGGLLEHTVAVATLCAGSAGLYHDVDRDLLVTAALLHDIGKVDELSWGTTIEYTDDGRLVGHVVLGEQRVLGQVSAKAPEVPRALLTRLLHAVLSHHGELEWGAPKRPSTLEALLLHHADNMDAKASGFTELTVGASALDERWTDAQNLFRRPLFAPSAVDDDRPQRTREDDQYACSPG
ncbi:MAG: HD domain-containing protein [Coriobacteriia bacterium]|nr:HD domain-containing protein [Coriobacteriia bacterium]